MKQEAQAIKEEALLRMEMSQQFTNIFKRGFQLFSDPQMLISKNMTPSTFWFYVDALYFYNDTHTDKGLQHIQYCLDSNQNYEFEELQDLQWILKLRNLVSNEKMGTLNLEDIKSTSIEQVIEISQNYLEAFRAKNAQKLQNCWEKQQKECQNLSHQLQKFGIQFRPAHPMFYYEELQANLRTKWTQQYMQQQNKDKCYLCSQPNKLVTCNKCHLKVHPTCYPTSTHRFDNKATKPSEEELKRFVCENCVNNVDHENQKCQLCCCIGGNFVKISDDQHYPKMGTIVLNKQNVNEENKNFSLHFKQIHQSELESKQGQVRKQKYAHLTCFIWNTDLKWNIQKNQVQGFNRNIKKKMNGICSFCGISFGVAIPCSNDTCRRFYHGQCAKRHNIEMNLIRAKTSVIELYCERHRHLNISQALEQKEIKKYKEVKKMFEGIDKEIKRLHVISSYQQVKLVAERDYCSICGKQEGRDKITICKQCRKWYHNICSQSCKNCS